MSISYLGSGKANVCHRKNHADSKADVVDESDWEGLRAHVDGKRAFGGWYWGLRRSIGVVGEEKVVPG